MMVSVIIPGMNLYFKVIGLKQRLLLVLKEKPSYHKSNFSYRTVNKGLV